MLSKSLITNGNANLRFTMKWNALIMKQAKNGQKKARRLALSGGGVERDTSSQHVAYL